MEIRIPLVDSVPFSGELIYLSKAVHSRGGASSSRCFLLPAMACVTLAMEYEADLRSPAVRIPFAPCRRLDLDTTADSARETSAFSGAPPLVSPLPAGPPAGRR